MMFFNSSRFAQDFSRKAHRSKMKSKHIGTLPNPS